MRKQLRLMVGAKRATSSRARNERGCEGAQYDVAAALELAPLYLPDTILLDIDMPGLDGYETARRIRSEPWGIDITLIAMNGYCGSPAS